VFTVNDKIEITLQRIERMRRFRKAFENRSQHVFRDDEDITADSIRYCDAMIQNWEAEIGSLKERLLS
jgi:hypothetical protein